MSGVVLARGRSRVMDGTVPRDGLTLPPSPRDRDGLPPRTAPAQPPPTRPVPPPTAPPLTRQKTPRHVSDVATTALHSAAFQKLNEGASGTFNTFRIAAGGQLKEIVKREKLDGHRSSDISYHADRLGHGLNSPTLRPSTSPRTPLLAAAEQQPADPLLASLGSPAASPRPPSRAAPSSFPVPSNRAEAVATADRLRRGLEHLAADADIAEDISLWDAALADVVAQVLLPLHVPPGASAPPCRCPYLLSSRGGTSSRRCRCTASSAASCSTRSGSTTGWSAWSKWPSW